MTFIAVWSRLPPVLIDSSIAVPERVEPGGMVEIERTVRKTRGDCRGGVVAAQVIDSHRQIRTLEPSSSPSASSPETGTITAKWMVPEAMPVGETTYRSTVAYGCFPFYGLWPVTVEYPAVVFWVQESRTQKFGGEPRGD
jgi:hypothetical protein